MALNPMDMTRRNNFEAATELLIGEAIVATEAQLDEWHERFEAPLMQIYGMTENAGIGSANRLSDEYRPGSAGRPYFTCVIVVHTNE